jgi:hypothetical protein
MELFALHKNDVHWMEGYVSLPGTKNVRARRDRSHGEAASLRGGSTESQAVTERARSRQLESTGG